MARQRYDVGSKWLLQHHGKAALLLGGIEGVRSYKPLTTEIVQSKKIPDGLLEVYLGSETKPHHVLVEVATYSEKRALRQALEDLALAYSVLKHLPELLMLVLRPKGRFRIAGAHGEQSRLGLSRLSAEWKTVEVWNLPAEQFLAGADVGVVPLVPLMAFEGPPEPILERCRERIEREVPLSGQAELLAVAQVFLGLRFPDPDLRVLLGGRATMIESPVVQELIAESIQECILEVLKDRFGSVPRNVVKLLRAELKEKKLRKWNVLAAKCADLEEFREALLK